jgi:hypothetical protein
MDSEGESRSFATVSLNQVERWRADSQSLESIGSFVFSAMPVNAGKQAMFLAAIGADPEFLSTLGVHPALGRNLPGSGSKLKDPSVIISHRLWVEAFGSDPQVLGRSLDMDGAASTIAGVLPASFQFPRSGFRAASRTAEAGTPGRRTSIASASVCGLWTATPECALRVRRSSLVAGVRYPQITSLSLPAWPSDAVRS